jgi:cytochrome c5
MTMRLKRLFSSFVLLASVQAFLQASPQNQAVGAQAGKKVAAANSTQQHQSEGERVFQQNCARCHNAPEGFSPHIAGTIVRHMRVRAALSRHDEEELLHFLNP